MAFIFYSPVYNREVHLNNQEEFMNHFFRLTLAVLIGITAAQAQIETGAEAGKDPLLIVDEGIPTEEKIVDQEWIQTKTYITTVSKKKELAQEAPANITVLTQEQIQDLGVTNLYEALSFIPGITVIETYFGISSVTFRNNIQDHYNHKSLLLINGHPFFDTTNFSYNLEIIPIEAVKQIEVIRGPGSVLYGTNAYAGVINIITYDGEKNSFKTSAKGGSFGTREYSLSTQVKEGDFKCFAAASYGDNDGYNAKLKRDEMGFSRTFDYENDVKNAYAGLQYKDLSFNTGYFTQDKEKIGFIPSIYLTGQNYYDGFFTDLEFQHEFTDTLSLQINGRYDRLDKEYDLPSRYGGYTSIELPGYKYGSEAQINYTPIENVSLILGSSWDRYKIDPDWQFLTLPTYLGNMVVYYSGKTYQEEASAYSSLSWGLTDSLKFVAGARYYDNTRTGTDTTPNAGLIYELAEGKYIKFLYGEAYRAPTIYEQICNMPGIYLCNPNLTPETIKTYDLGLDLIFNQKYSLKSNLFYLSTYDSISLALDSQGSIVFSNTEGQEVYGLELDFRADVTSKVSLFMNTSFNQGELKENSKDIPYMVEYTANAGINWKIVDSFSVHMNTQYVGERKDNDTDYAADDYTLFNLQTVYSLEDSLKIRLIANNLFDKECYYPEFGRQVIGDCINGAGQAFYGKIEYTY